MDIEKIQLRTDLNALVAEKTKLRADVDALTEEKIKLTARVEAIEKRLAPKPDIFTARPKPKSAA